MAVGSMGSGSKGSGPQKSRRSEVPKRRRRWRSGVQTQQGKRQRERELERAGGGHGVRSGQEEEDEVPTSSYLLCYLSHRLDTGPVEVAVVLASLNELVRLNVLLHFLPGGDKVVIPAIYLIFPLRTCRICQEVIPPHKDLTTTPLMPASSSQPPRVLRETETKVGQNCRPEVCQALAQPCLLQT